MPDQENKQPHVVKPSDSTFEAIKYHASGWINRRILYQRIHRRVDFIQTYNEMIKECWLEEKGEGTKKSPIICRFVADEQDRIEVQRKINRRRGHSFVLNIGYDEFLRFGAHALANGENPEQVLRSLLEAYRSGQITL